MAKIANQVEETTVLSRGDLNMSPTQRWFLLVAQFVNVWSTNLLLPSKKVACQGGQSLGLWDGDAWS